MAVRPRARARVRRHHEARPRRPNSPSPSRPPPCPEVKPDWVEYGLVERAYALAHPVEWAKILVKFDHTEYHDGETTSRGDLPYTASMYLARTLGALSGTGRLGHRSFPGTGRWAYNNPISFYSLPGADPFGPVATWEEAGVKMSDYMPADRPK